MDEPLRSYQTKRDQQKKKYEKPQEDKNTSNAACWEKDRNHHDNESTEARCDHTKRYKIYSHYRIIKDSCLIDDAVRQKKGKAVDKDHPGAVDRAFDPTA